MSLRQESIAGVDEVGRGCLFGPVFAGAVILSQTAANELLEAGLKDSKTLTPKKRARLFPQIITTCTAWGLGQASPKEIDNFGIRHATELAMLRALQRLPKPPEMILVDGVLQLKLWERPQKTVIRGDSYYPSIAAASVIAKETRDQLIKRLAIRFPEYGLEKHVGYGTALHKKVLKNSGPTHLHRQSFLSKVI